MEQGRRDSRQQPLKVGLYDIEHTIGKGNFAVVKLAKHRITKTPVAIKIIDKSKLDEANLKKVHREVQVMKLLRHPNILKLYQVMETDNMLYLVTEYATRGEMFAYIDQNGQLPENEARRVFRQILSAVDHCHKRHVVHRDIKTENVLLDENLNIKIADFGFGNYFEENELLKTFCGSPPYAAPEVFEGKLYDGPAVDAWSLGVVLYVLVCAALPFDGTKLHEIRDRVLEGRYRVPYFMSSELEDLIKRILVKNPQQRYTLEQIRCHPWMQENGHSDADVLHAETRERDVLIESAVDRGVQGDFNAQVLALMRELHIDEDKTKLAVMRNSYDHHSAIYYLLLERLKQHRSSYPEQSQTSTRLRRASVTADQIIVRNGMVQQIVHPSANSIPQPTPKWTPIQYAFRELHLGEVDVPKDMQQSAMPGLGIEMRPTCTVATPTPVATTTITAGVGCSVVVPTHTMRPRSGGHCIMAVSETIDEDMDESPTELRGTRQAEEARPRRRRAAIQQLPPSIHALHEAQPQETLYVPANHPLLKQNAPHGQPSADDATSIISESNGDDYQPCVMDEAHGFKIQIIPPVEPAPSQQQGYRSSAPPKNTRLSMTLSPRNFEAFTEGRRASDGNSTNAPFRQLLRKSDVQPDLQDQLDPMEVMMLQCEHQELQQLYRRCLTPDEARQQQMQHSLFMEKLDERIGGFVPIDDPAAHQQHHMHEFLSAGSLLAPQNFDLTDPMRQLNIHTSQQLNAGSAENNNTLGPFRRQASYRKLANSPILHHPRGGSYKRSQRHPTGFVDDNSPYSSFEL